jgi:hypothetical protein
MKKYDEIVSFGSQCDVGLSLRSMDLKGETYPFDWVCSNPKIIYDVLVNGPSRYVTFDGNKNDDYYVNDLGSRYDFNIPKDHINFYGQHFTHYTGMSSEELTKTLSRYLERFFNLLKSEKTVLFVCSHEEYLYHKISHDNKNEFYNYLCKINDNLCENYPQLKFTILNIDINNTHNNYKNIINTSIDYAYHFSDGETRKPAYFEPYRNSITGAIKNFLEC